MKTLLLIGLGNPGEEYQKTRHNAGFMFVDCFFEKFRDEFHFSDWKFSKKMSAEISLGKTKRRTCLNISTYGEIFKHGGKIILIKPQTFMNLSGSAVAAAMKYYKVRMEDIIIVHDDIDLPLGKYKFSINSSSAGHNGVQNIIDRIGTKNFTRLRIGVDNRSGKKIPTEKYVLGKFTSAELKNLQSLFKKNSAEIFKTKNVRRKPDTKIFHF